MPLLPDLPPCPVCPRRHSPGCRNKDGARIQLVHPTGPDRARVMLIGEGPGRDENRTGTAFIGKVGQELDLCYLPAAELHRPDVYATNAMKCQRQDGESPTPDEARQCAEWWLPGELQRVQPQYVVLMGGVSGRAVLPRKWAARHDLEMHHGQVIHSREWGLPQLFEYRPSWPVYTVATYHPAAGLHGSEMMTPLLEDFAALAGIMRALGRGQWPHLVDTWPSPVYGELTTGDEVAAALSDGNSATRGRWVAVDTEADGLTGPPWCLSFSTSPGVGWVVPSDARDALRVFQAWVTGDSYRGVLLHNATFDVDVLRRMGVMGYRWRDTMHTAYQLGSVPQGLKPLAWRLAGMEMQEYRELVRGPSLGPVAEWAARVRATVDAGTPVKMPRKKLVIPPEVKEWRKQARLLDAAVSKGVDWQRETERLQGLGLGGNDADFRSPWKWWDDRIPEVRRLLGLLGGGVGMPQESIIHVDRGRAVRYAARDADATLRVWWALRGRIRRLGRMVPVGGSGQVQGGVM